jgi:hypothetical protein
VLHRPSAPAARARTGPADSAWSDPTLRHRALGLGAYVGATVLAVALVAGTFAGSRVGVILLIGLGGGAAAATFAVALTVALSDGAGAAVRAIIMPSGASTPYRPTFSQQEARAAHGDLAGALASFEELIAGSPDGVEVRLRAAEMYATQSTNPARAAELLREARDLPSATRAQALYASNRLIDLYLGPLGDEGRALVECRRLIERHPRSSAAAGARQVIERLKGTGDRGPGTR